MQSAQSTVTRILGRRDPRRLSSDRHPHSSFDNTGSHMPNIVPEPGPSTRRRSGSSARRRAVADIASAAIAQGTLRPDDPARDGIRLGLVAFVTLASGIGILALGSVAERAGIERWLGMGEMLRPIGSTFVTGARMPGAMLRALYEAGVVEPLFFAAAMALLIPPIAGIVAARPLRPGLAPPKPAARIAAGIAAALVVAADVGIVSIAALLSILLAVLVFRMPLDRWARGLVGTISIATAVLATGAAAASAGTLDFLETPRPVIATDLEGAGLKKLDLARTMDGGIAVLGPIGLVQPAALPHRSMIRHDQDFIIIESMTVVEVLTTGTSAP
jgi:hypothetical protein